MNNKGQGTLKRILNSRSLKYGSNSLILIAIVVAMAVIINLLVGMAGLKWDLTSNKLFSVGDTTTKILKDLKQDVYIYGLFDEAAANSNNELKQVTEVLNQYRKYDHIKIQYKDPDKNPGFLKEIYDDTKRLEGANFVVKSGNKIKTLTTYDLYDVQFDQQTMQDNVKGVKAEQGFTGAVKYVTAEYTPVVYFTEGHGENKVDETYGTVKTYLDRNNYEIKTVNLMTSDKVPSDAEILVVASPKTDLNGDEKYRIKDYLKNGGKAIFLLDSLESDVKLTQFEDILADYNISLNYDSVKENDENRHVPQNAYDILPDLQSSSINSALSNAGNFYMIMPKSRSINIMKNQKDALTVESLLKTSDKAVGEQIDKSRGNDLQGPLDLAVAAQYTGSAKPAKVLVMGNSSFMSDAAMNKYSNLSQNGMIFFLNALNWMQDKKDDLSIAPKTYDVRKMNITQTQANVAALFVVIILPLLILGAGMFVWLRRRHL